MSIKGSKANTAALLGMWLLGAQIAMGWLVFVDCPKAIEWLARAAGSESLSENAIRVLSFAEEMQSPVAWTMWATVVLGLAWASFRGRNWSVRWAVALLALLQLAGVLWAHQVLEDERVRAAADVL